MNYTIRLQDKFTQNNEMESYHAMVKSVMGNNSVSIIPQFSSKMAKFASY